MKTLLTLSGARSPMSSQNSTDGRVFDRTVTAYEDQKAARTDVFAAFSHLIFILRTDVFNRNSINPENHRHHGYRQRMQLCSFCGTGE